MKFVPRRFALALVFLPIGEAISFNFPITSRAKPNILGTNFKIGSLMIMSLIFLISYLWRRPNFIHIFSQGMCIKELSPDQRPYYYKTSNLEICTKKVCFGSVSDWSSAGFLASHWLKVRAKPNLLGTNFKIGSLIIIRSLISTYIT